MNRALSNSSRSGSGLFIVVMVLAFIGMLLGFGRLNRYRYQTHLRLDRQREIQQELVSRASIRWLETKQDRDPFPEERGVPYFVDALPYGILAELCPVDPIFPRVGTKDFNLASSESQKIDSYEYVGKTGPFPKWTSVETDPEKQWVFADATIKELGTVNRMVVDVDADKAQALWTEQDYGLRYLMYINHFGATNATDVASANDGDLLRFGITPLSGNPKAENLSLSGSEYAIWLEGETLHTVGELTLRLKAKKPQGQTVTLIETTTQESGSHSSIGGKGFQCATTKACIVEQKRVGSVDGVRSTGCSEVVDLNEAMEDAKFVDRFKDACKKGVRMIVELEVRRPRLDPGTGNALDDQDPIYLTAIRKLAITPTYEFFVRQSWEENGLEANEVSTVIRCNPNWHGETTANNHVNTYDTHGTMMKRKYQTGVGDVFGGSNQ